jgi:hypothetical protein
MDVSHDRFFSEKGRNLIRNPKDNNLKMKQVYSKKSAVNLRLFYSILLFYTSLLSLLLYSSNAFDV